MAFFKTSDGMMIHYEDTKEGNAGTIVLMHGGFASSGDYEPSVKHYAAKGYRVITFDARGHGISSKPDRNLSLERWATDVEELFELLNLKDIVLLGYSFSVHVMFNYVELFGCERLKKVVLLDMSPKWISDETWPYGIYKGRYTHQAHLDWMHLLEKDPHKAYWYFIKECGTADPVGENYVPEITDAAVAFPYHVGKTMMMELATRDYRDMLDKITVPALIVYGEPGSLYQRGDAEEMAKRIPNAKLAPVKGGHEFYAYSPEQLHNAMDEFLAE